MERSHAKTIFKRALDSSTVSLLQYDACPRFRAVCFQYSSRSDRLLFFIFAQASRDTGISDKLKL